jgi:hypothetical protein
MQFFMNPLRHRPVALATGEAFVPTGFVPEREFYTIPESKFVKDDAQVIFHNVLRGADDFGYLAVLESLSDQFDDLMLAWAGNAGSVETVCGYV